MFSSCIARLRKASGMSQQELAKKMNLSPSAIGMYEQGKREPSIETLVRLADVFEISLDYLITGLEYTGQTDRTELIKRKTPDSCPCETCYWKSITG